MSILIQQIDDRGVLRLTMNRPQVHNAFNPELIAVLTQSFKKASQDPAVRIVVLSGIEPCFSAGADLNWMRDQVNASPEQNEADAMKLAAMLRALNYLDRPTIAKVNGPTFGGGMGLVACCDIAIAEDVAQFGLTEARLGLAPAVISPYLIRRIGEHNARRYILTGERFSPREALAMGLLHEVVPEHSLEKAVEKTIQRLLKSAPIATRECKQLINTICGHDAAQQAEMDEYTSRLIARLRVSSEGQEGLAAFLEKRAAAWVKND